MNPRFPSSTAATMTSPSTHEPRRPSLAASPRTGLLPSPFAPDADDETPPADVTRQRQQHHSFVPEPDPVGDDYPEAQDGSLLAPPGFAPLFTMITDTQTGETYHPSTHYLFADDEPDELSRAALHALDSFSPAALQEADDRARQQGIPRHEERFVLVSLGADGASVVSAKSLAPSWAVTNAEIRLAPTFDGGSEQGGDGLMLMVDGLSEAATTTAPRAGPKTQKEKHAQARAMFEDARKKGGGSVITAMEEIAQTMFGDIKTLDKIVSMD